MKKRLSKSLYSDRWEQLLKILKRLRLEKGLTQTELAAQLDRPQSLIAKIESGERKLDVCQFLDYMEALGASAEGVIREMEHSAVQISATPAQAPTKGNSSQEVV